MWSVLDLNIVPYICLIMTLSFDCVVEERLGMWLALTTNKVAEALCFLE